MEKLVVISKIVPLQYNTFAIIVFVSFALKHLMHYIILILSHLSARPRARGAEFGSSSGASPKGVWWSTRDKLHGYSYFFARRQAPVHLTTILEFMLSYILIMNLAYALGCRNWSDALVALGLLSYPYLVDPIARHRLVALARHRCRIQ
jgi:hypothetical protein